MNNSENLFSTIFASWMLQCSINHLWIFLKLNHLAQHQDLRIKIFHLKVKSLTLHAVLLLFVSFFLFRFQTSTHCTPPTVVLSHLRPFPVYQTSKEDFVDEHEHIIYIYKWRPIWIHTFNKAFFQQNHKIYGAIEEFPHTLCQLFFKY